MAPRIHTTTNLLILSLSLLGVAAWNGGFASPKEISLYSDEKGLFLYDLESMRIWSRCPAGMHSGGTGCTGDRISLDEGLARRLCASSRKGGLTWRIPGLDELESFESCSTESDHSTDCETGSAVRDSDGVWADDAGKGVVYFGAEGRADDRGNAATVRCVAEWDGSKISGSRKREDPSLVEKSLRVKLEEFNTIFARLMKPGASRAGMVRALSRYMEPSPHRMKEAGRYFDSMRELRLMDQGSDATVLALDVVVLESLQVAVVTNRLEGADSLATRLIGNLRREREVWVRINDEWYLSRLESP